MRHRREGRKQRLARRRHLRFGWRDGRIGPCLDHRRERICRLGDCPAARRSWLCRSRHDPADQSYVPPFGAGDRFRARRSARPGFGAQCNDRGALVLSRCGRLSPVVARSGATCRNQRDRHPHRHGRGDARGRRARRPYEQRCDSRASRRSQSGRRDGSLVRRQGDRRLQAHQDPG